jgi:uncharacterized protein (DUF983 family)
MASGGWFRLYGGISQFTYLIKTWSIRMPGFDLNGQVYKQIGFKIINGKNGVAREYMVFRSHCADCGEEFEAHCPSDLQYFTPNRRCPDHSRPGEAVKRKNLADPKPGTPAKQFKPGDRCRTSGVYVVRHKADHLPARHLIVYSGTEFLPCCKCGSKVRYELATSVSSIDDRKEFRYVARTRPVLTWCSTPSTRARRSRHQTGL